MNQLLNDDMPLRGFRMVQKKEVGKVQIDGTGLAVG